MPHQPFKWCSVRINILILLFSSSQGEGLPLLAEEKADIEELLPATTSQEDKETVFSILGQAICRPTEIQVNSQCLNTIQHTNHLILNLSSNNHNLKKNLLSSEQHTKDEVILK